jgi:ceramide glucosyltransferase
MLLAVQIFVLASLAMTTYAWMLTKSINNPKKPTKPKRKRPISILKPMKGFDYGFVQNIESFFSLDFYPGDELIFCFENKSDGMITFIRNMMNVYPHVPAKISTGGWPFGINPKIQNIFHAYQNVKNDMVLISDSNVEAPDNYLNLVDYEHTEGDGVLTAAVVGTRSITMAAQIENMLLQRFYNKWLVVLNSINVPIVMGKSIFFSKKNLEKQDGLYHAVRYLAEDYTIGQMHKREGLKTKVLSIPVKQAIGRRTFRELFDRYARWGRMRRAHEPLVFYFEPLMSFSIVSTMATIAFPFWFALIFNTVWCWIEIATLKRLGSETDPLAYMMSEWLTLPIWFYTLMSDKVEWRGRIYKMQPGGTCKEVKTA